MQKMLYNKSRKDYNIKGVEKMPKKEVFIEKELAVRLREIADSEKISEEEVIQKAIKEYIEDYNAEKNDPLLNLIGIADEEDGEDENGSENSDHNLYGGEVNE